MWSRKLSPSASFWFNRSWQTCIRCSLCSCVSIHGTHLAQTLWYSNVATIVSNGLKPIFSSVHSFLVVIRRFAQMNWSRCSSCHGVTAVYGRLEHGLSFTAEVRHPLSHCANIHVWQASLNVIGCNFLRMEEFNYTPLLHTHFHVRRHFVRLPLYCHLSHGNKI